MTTEGVKKMIQGFETLIASKPCSETRPSLVVGQKFPPIKIDYMKNIRQLKLAITENNDKRVKQLCDELIKYCDSLETDDLLELLNFVRTAIEAVLSIVLLENEYSDVLYQLSWSLHTRVGKSILTPLCNSREKKLRSETFYSFIQQLSSSSISRYLEDQITNEKQRNSCSVIIWIIVTIINCSLDSSEMHKTDLDQHILLFQVLLRYINQHFNSDTQYVQVNIELILKLIWSLVDQTMLIPFFVGIDLPKAILTWMQQSETKVHGNLPLINILHNIARHDAGAEKLNNYGAIPVLEAYKKQKLKNEWTECDPAQFDLIYSMSTLLLLSPDEVKSNAQTAGNILDQLIELAVKASQTNDWKCDLVGLTFHITESLVVLTKLFVNDDVVDYVLKRSQSDIRFFANLLCRSTSNIDSDEDEYLKLTQITLFNIVWSISFSEKYNKELKLHKKLIVQVEEVAKKYHSAEIIDHYVPKHFSNIKKAADGILFNLKTEYGTAAAVRKPNKNVKPFVMISYSHADRSFCTELVNRLTAEKNIDVWTDFSSQGNNNEVFHSYDLWEQIAHAIEKANVVLLIMTENYYKSKSCRQEVAYANDSLNKRIIPIYPYNNYIATGWLGVRIAPLTYIHFGRKTFSCAMKELINAVMEQQSVGACKATNDKDITPIKVTEPTAERLPRANISVRNWLVDDVASWFHKNGISHELRILYDFQSGSELLDYGNDFRRNFDQEKKDTRKRFEKKFGEPMNTVQFNRFKDALYRLIDKQDCIQRSYRF